MNSPKTTVVVAALSISASCFFPANILRAEDPSVSDQTGHVDSSQTPEQATAILLQGKWRFHGVDRTFHKDGTLSSANGNMGTWRMESDQLIVALGTLKFRFFLPLDPKGTRGDEEKTKEHHIPTLTLERVSK